jgi:hypothetical protein
MDKIIFGDNQFFGVNHMSEQTSIKQSQKFKSADDIFKTLVCLLARTRQPLLSLL